MPRLIKNIEANLIQVFNTEINFMTIESEVGFEDYFKVGNLEGFVQNMSKVVYGEELEISGTYGLKRNKNEEFVLLEISY